MPVSLVAAKVLLAAHTSLMHKVTANGTSPASRLARKLGNYYEKIGIRSAQEFYLKLCYIHDHPEELVIGGHDPVLPGSKPLATLNYAEWMMLQDALTYFPGDILTKVDRASMAISLETRTPFTDPDIMGFAWQLPFSMKIHRGQSKWALRQLLYRYVPESLIERPKAGFAVPLGAWLRGPLKSWAADLLAPDTLKQQGFLNPAAIKTMWSTHQSGQRDMEHRLWNVLMFQSWLANNS